MSKFKVDQETAEIEFENFCEVFDLSYDVEAMEDEEVATFEKHKADVIAAVRKGKIVFEGELVTLVTSDGEEVKFKEPTGATYMAADKRKESVSKLFVMMGDCAGVDGRVFNKMKQRDLKPAMAVFSLFLG